MNEIKLIIEVHGGTVQQVKSNVPLKYLILDYDLFNIGISPLSVPLEPDAVARPLYTLYDESDNQQEEIREELKRMKF